MTTDLKPAETLKATALREVLHYNAETGIFTWKQEGKRRIGRVGKPAGWLTADGYIHIKVFGNSYGAHRLAWLYMTGAWPACQIDHKDGNRSDNRFSQLREASRAQQKANSSRYKNNKSGFKGVTLSGDSGRWSAQVRHNRKLFYLGLFDTPEEAHSAYVAKAKELFGEFVRAA